MSDNPQREQGRDALERAVDRELLAAMTVHELREPIHAVQNFLSILLQQRPGPLNEVQLDFLATAQQAIRRMARRIEDVRLAFDDQEAMSLDRHPVDLLAHVQECCRELMPLAGIYGVGFEIRRNDQPRSASPPLLCYADPERLDQILLNVLENAIHHAASGSVVAITVARVVGGGAVTIENITDSELATEPENWFAPYWRTQRRGGRGTGMGLGLVVAGHLVRAHGGAIEACARGRHVYVGIMLPEYLEHESAARAELEISEPDVLALCGVDC